MREYSLTFDASHKVTKQGGHHIKWLQHIGRDVDQRNGVKRKHHNPGIDARRTLHNRTFVRGVDGAWKRADSTEEMLASIESRLSDVVPRKSKAGKEIKQRKDAVVIRPLVLQLDPRWMDQHSPDWRRGVLSAEAQRMINEQRMWAEEEFGEENVRVFSLHLDERSVQMQLGLVPVTEDGRLNQSAFFKGKNDLGRMHSEYRDRMIAAGYPATLERVTAERKVRHYDDAEFKRWMNDLDGAAVEAKQAADEERERLARHRRELDQEKAELAQEWEALHEREQHVSEALEQASTALQAAQRAIGAARDYEQAAVAMREALKDGTRALVPGKSEPIKASVATMTKARRQALQAAQEAQEQLHGDHEHEVTG